MDGQQELHWQYREKPDKPFEDNRDLPFGRYQIISFSANFPLDALAEIVFVRRDIHDSKKISYGVDGIPRIHDAQGERQLIDAEKNMQIFCLQRIELEEIYPLLQKIAQHGEAFYFRFNKVFTPDPIFFAAIATEDIPCISVDEIYDNVYRNKFDYIYHVTAESEKRE